MKKIINDLVWEINIAPTSDPALFVDGDMCRGTTWTGKQQIFLASDLNDYTANRVIIHELTHAYLWSTQMRLPETYTEEELCEFMACWGSKIMMDAVEVFTALYYGSEDNAKE